MDRQLQQFIELFDTDLVSISASSPAFLRRASGLQPATAAVVASVGVGGGASGSASCSCTSVTANASADSIDAFGSSDDFAHFAANFGVVFISSSSQAPIKS